MSIPNDILAEVIIRIDAVCPVSVSAVDRPTREGENVEAKDKQVIVTHETITHNDELSAIGNPAKIAWNFPLVITCLTNPSESNTDPIDSHQNDLADEVYNAIVAVDDWHTFDGNCIHSEFADREMVASGDSTLRKTVLRFNCIYRVEETNITELA